MPSKPAADKPPTKAAAAKAAKEAPPNDSADQQAAEAPPEEAPTPDREMNIEEYEQHRLEVLARIPEEKDRPKNIYARLAQINGLIGLIRKTGVNQFHRYTYAKEADLVEEVRPILSEYGIWLEQGLWGDPETGFIPHQRLGQITREGVARDTLTAITKRFRFVWWNAEAGALETTEWEPFMGYGDDAGDKGYYKAETGAVKYFLMKTFMVATGNDPEADRAADERAAGRDASSGVEVRRGGGRGQTQRGPAQPGGRQQQTSAPQSRQIGELLRAAGIKSTIDAIAKLEGITGDKVEPIKGEEDDLAAALQAYISKLAGPKAGAIIQKLREEASKPAGETEPDANRDNSSQPPETPAAGEGGEPKAAGWVDEDAGDAEQGPWSTRDGVAPTDAKADDASDDGTIGSAIE